MQGRDLLLSCDDTGESGGLLTRGNPGQYTRFYQVSKRAELPVGFPSQGIRFSLPRRLMTDLERGFTSRDKIR